MATFKLLLFPGDGIGPEVMAEVEKIIDCFAGEGVAKFETEKGLVGGCAYDAHGKAISESDMALAGAADAILFAAVGGPKWDGVPYDVRPEAGLLRLRKDLALYANLRPAICYPALASASSLKPEVVEGLDIMIVRELTGGVYFGEPKQITDLGNGQRRAIDTQVYDTYEIERIGRTAFELARNRGNKVTSAEKRNVMKSGVLWNEVMTALHKREFSDVKLEHQLADALGMQLVRRHAVRRRGHVDGFAWHAAFRLAWRRRSEERPAQGALRACSRIGAGHRRQGSGHPSRDDRVVRHGLALFLRTSWPRRPARCGNRRRARRRVSNCGHPRRRRRH